MNNEHAKIFFWGNKTPSLSNIDRRLKINFKVLIKKGVKKQWMILILDLDLGCSWITSEGFENKISWWF